MSKADDTAHVVLDSLELISSKQQLAVLYHLQTGEKQFDELLELTDASSQTLSELIDDLEECGFVDRRLGTDTSLETNYRCSQELTGTTPGGEDTLVSTAYSLTPKGAALEEVFEAVESWGTEWLEPGSAQGA